MRLMIGLKDTFFKSFSSERPSRSIFAILSKPEHLPF